MLTGKTLYTGFTIGESVTTTEPFAAFGGGMDGYPPCEFAPGDVGRVADLNFISSQRGDRWLVIDFFKPGVPRRGPGTPAMAPEQPWRVRMPASAARRLSVPMAAD